MKGLSTRMKELIEFIQGYIKKHKYSPSLQVIGDEFGFSRQAAHYSVQTLIRKKYLKRDGTRALTILKRK